MHEQAVHSSREVGLEEGTRGVRDHPSRQTLPVGPVLARHVAPVWVAEDCSHGIPLQPETIVHMIGTGVKAFAKCLRCHWHVDLL